MAASIKTLRYFLAAVDRGSIVGAAEEMHVVPSAISSAIDQVETQFGLKLVQRFPAKGISPTAAGVALLRKVRHVIEEYDGLLLEGAELRTALSGKLSIGYYAPVAPAFLPSIVGPLMRAHPEIRLNVVECDNERAQIRLLNGELDAIVFAAEGVRSGIACETLIEIPPYLLVPEAHELARRESVGFADLARQRVVLLDLPLVNDYYRALLEAHAPDAAIVASASSTEMVRSLVSEGLGCAILNMRPSTDVTYAGRKVTAVPIRPAGRSLKLVLGHLGGNSRRLLRAFVEACTAYFQQPASRDFIVP